MNENFDSNEIKNQNEFPVKWLRILFYVSIAGAAMSVIPLLPINDAWTKWVNRGLSVAIAICLLQLAPANPRYRKAGIFRALVVALSFLSSVALLSLVASVLSLLSVYQEYSAHSELIEQHDARLSRNWHSLFNWQIIVGVLSSVVSMILTLVLVVAQMDTNVITTIVLTVIQTVSLVLGIIYLVYLKRMIGYLQNQN